MGIVVRRNVLVGRLILRVQQLEHSLGRSNTRLQHIHHGGHLGKRLGELTGVLDKCLNITETHRTRCHPKTTDDGDSHIVQVAEEHHRRLDDSGDELSPETGLIKLLVLLSEAFVNLMLATESLHDRVTGKCFVHLRVEHAGVLPLRDETRPGSCRDLAHHEDGHRDGHNCDECQDRRDDQHHHDHADQCQDRDKQLAQGLLQALRHIVNVVRDATQQVAARLAVYVGKRQPIEFVLNLRSEIAHRALHDAAQQERLGVGQQRRTGEDGNSEQDRAMEGCEVHALFAA